VIYAGTKEDTTTNKKLQKFNEFDHVFVKNYIDQSSLTTSEFFAVVKSDYTDVDQKASNSECYVCFEEDEAFDIFKDLSMKIRKETSTYSSVYMYQVYQRKDELKFSSSIAKSYNFKNNSR
jgi:hypothetical protein